MSEAVQGLNKVFNRLKRLERDVRELEQPTKKSGEVMLRSIRKNFAVGGRPKFAPLAASTLRRKKGNRILVESGETENSLEMRSSGNRASAGTDLDRAKYPFGGTSRMPARNPILFQPEDITGIGNIFKQHIANGRIK